MSSRAMGYFWNDDRPSAYRLSLSVILNSESIYNECKGEKRTSAIVNVIK